jgi:hypothetical protein
MAAPLIPQEIYLLERFCSLEYYVEMLNAWAKMVEAAEEALRQFTLNLPPDLRSRPLYEQYDITWGERVLPNFRSTLASLEAGYIMLKNGDLSALGFGGNVKSAINGQTSDYPTDWMPKDLEKQFWDWQLIAGNIGFNLYRTESAGWYMTDLTTRYHEVRGPLNPPASWPQYRLNPKVTVKTGDTVKESGIYLPACDNSCAEVQIQGYECLRAHVGDNSVPKPTISRAETTWTLVERIADSGGGTPGNFDVIDSVVHLRIEGGQICTQTGWYFTPAKTNSRRYVSAGTMMPMFDTDYGSTIWQWDQNQEAPKL